MITGAVIAIVFGIVIWIGLNWIRGIEKQDVEDTRQEKRKRKREFDSDNYS